jgi:hypothetical protein
MLMIVRLANGHLGCQETGVEEGMVFVDNEMALAATLAARCPARAGQGTDGMA